MSTPFTVYSLTTGQILRAGFISSGSIESQCMAQEGVLDCFVDESTHYISQGSAVPKGVKPTANHTFNLLDKQWQDQRSLQGCKDVRNAYINAQRLFANQTTFVFMGKQISADPLSRSDIGAVHGIVALTNEMPDNWVGWWKAADNTYVSIPNVVTWTLFYKAMVGQGSVNFAHSQELKAQLAAATTIEEVEAIVW